MRKIALIVLFAVSHIELNASQQSSCKNWALAGGIVGFIGTGVSAWTYKMLEKKYTVAALAFKYEQGGFEYKNQKAKKAIEEVLHTINKIDNDHTRLKDHREKQAEDLKFIRENAESLEMAQMHPLKALEEHNTTCRHCSTDSVSLNEHRKQCNEKQHQLILLAMYFKDKEAELQEQFKINKHKLERKRIALQKIEKKKDWAFKTTAGLGLLTSAFFSAYWWLTNK